MIISGFHCIVQLFQMQLRYGYVDTCTQNFIFHTQLLVYKEDSMWVVCKLWQRRKLFNSAYFVFQYGSL
jgi:hypothetical protein